MFQTYKNLPIKLNGREVFVQSAELSVQAEIEPNYLVGELSTNTYVATNNSNGQLSLNYYLTGTDPIKDLGY